MRNLVLGLGLVALTGCATIHEGQMGKIRDGDQISGMKISAQETSDPRNSPFSLFTVTIENESDDWMRIDSIEADFDAEMAKTHSVVLGDDLTSWAEANAEMQRLKDYNKEWMKTGLFSAGLVAALVSAHNGSTAGTVAGTGVVAGVSGYSVGQRIIRNHHKIIHANTIPEKHLYRPFSVPGKLFVRRWLLINKPSGHALTALALTIKTIDGKVSRVNLPLQAVR